MDHGGTSSTSHSTARCAQVSGEEDSRSYIATGELLPEYAAVVMDYDDNVLPTRTASPGTTGAVNTSIEGQLIRERGVGERRGVDGIRVVTDRALMVPLTRLNVRGV